MNIAILIAPGVQLLDVIGPLEVFAEGATQAQLPGFYKLCVIGTLPGPIQGFSGLTIVPDRSIQDSDEEIDTLLVAGGANDSGIQDNPEALDWIRRNTDKARRYGSVCTGAFGLAAAGVIDGLCVTTHWHAIPRLAQRYPAVSVEPDRIFVKDGRVYTSAGVTAGMDLALALVEEDLGRRVALAVARQLVMFVKRPGGQSQFSPQLAAQIADRSTIQDIQAWALVNLGGDLSIPALARRAAMSERNFARVFRAESGLTPAGYVEAIRVDAARRMLEESLHPLKRIANITGFSNIDALRRAFLRTVGVTPTDYRERFGSALCRTEAPRRDVTPRISAVSR
jgi:transcriptional regulator GlxA family with amidase domain